MEASFAISNHRSDCCEVIKLAGDLDLATDDQLKNVIDHPLVVPDHLIVDVSEMTLIDSTGLRLLHRASALVAGRIWLKGCSSQIRRVIDISGLAQVFCLEADPELAHRLISAGEPARPRLPLSGLGRLPKGPRDNDPGAMKPHDPLGPGGFS